MRTPLPAPASVPPWARSAPVWLAAGFQLAAFACLLSFFLEPNLDRLWRGIAIFFSLFNFPVGPSGFAVAFYVVMAFAAVRRKRIVVWTVVWLFQMPTVLGVIGLVVLRNVVAQEMGMSAAMRDAITPRWTDVASVGVAILISLLLIRGRDAFPAKLEPGAWRRALITLISGVSLSILLGFALSFVDPGTLHSLRGRLRWAVSAAVAVVPDNPHGGAGPDWLATVVSAISILSLIAALAIFTRSARTGREMTADDELEIRRLLLAYPDSGSLGYFSTRREKSVVFSPDRQAAIAYRVLGGVCMASGDPIGDRKSWPAAIAQWMAVARTFGWSPAVMAASPAAAMRYEEVGLRVFQLGDEAVVDARRFDLEDPTLHQLRTEFRRVERAGYTLSIRRQSEIPLDELRGLGRLAAEWRHGERERGFSMALGRFGDPSDGSVLVVTAYSATGAVQGLLSFVPWGRRGLSLDLMRRSAEAVAGTTQFMIAGLLTEAPSRGIDRVSLNFAVLRHIFEDGDELGAGPIDKLALAVVRLASRRWQLESLYRSNERYRPTWSPRLLCYDRGANLTMVAITAGRLEGFLPMGGGSLGPRSRRDKGHDAGGGRPSVQAFAAQVAAQETEMAQIQAPVHQQCAAERRRRAKLDLLRAAGRDPYPVDVKRTLSVGEARARAQAGELGEVSLTGRIMSLRDHGGLIFATLREEGEQLQAMLRKDHCADLTTWRATVDRGDVVGVSGSLMYTDSGELTVDVAAWQMVAKCVVPMVDKYRGVVDPQIKVRMRHLDLATSDVARGQLLARSKIVQTIRTQLYKDGFIEVETPILQTVHGGANAQPFRTHANAFGLDLSLRIAPELALKKLCVAGFERIFELGRNFRNEGADSTHSPEFTSLEVYEAFADFDTMRLLTHRLIVACATAVYGRPVIRRPDGTQVDIGGPWPVVDVHDAVSSAVGQQIDPGTSADELARIAGDLRVGAARNATAGEIVARLYDKLVEPATQVPTFYTRFPVETSPLTRPDRVDARVAERWDLVAYGMELGTAYTELTDPVEQRLRLEAQSRLAAAGDPEAMEVDESFLRAMEFAMVPTGGLGLGVDRIAMLILGTSIRQTLAFPLVRPTN